jgi:hypothetical protein
MQVRVWRDCVLFFLLMVGSKGVGKDQDGVSQNVFVELLFFTMLEGFGAWCHQHSVESRFCYSTTI